jgi:hypothetical protein
MKPLFESRYIDPASNRISQILSLLGSVLLLPWPAKCKGALKKWKHLQLTDMSAPSHLAKVERAGNIGVALGRASNGLVTVDFDNEDYVEAFLEVNPLIRTTLRTTAQRGCNIWLRCTTDYPPSCKLRNRSGDEIGEWRADGNQTIIAGTHPDGVPYRFVVESPAIAIGYSEIVWPDVILAPATESKRVRRVIEKEGVSVGGGLQIQAFFGVDLIAQIAPTDYHQNNASLFSLARLVKSYENGIGRAATEIERLLVFDRWCLVTSRFWRPELTRDDYYAEFLEACSYARIGLDENPIEVAVSLAKTAPLPQVRGFTDERIRLLVAICREMQGITGAAPFFLPTRKLSETLGACHTQVARWLRILERSLRVIHLAPGEVRRRGGSRSPRYHYRPPTRNPLETTATNSEKLAHPRLHGQQHVPNGLHTTLRALPQNTNT